MTALLLLASCGVPALLGPSHRVEGSLRRDSGRADTGAVPPDDFVLTDVDESTYAGQGYVYERYELSPDASDPYLALDGQAPVFYLLRQASIPEGNAVPLVVWLHGGSFGDDSVSLPANCQGSQEKVEAVLSGGSLAGPEMMRAGMAVAIPRNDWCDGWLGWGPADQVDPEHHRGYQHVARMLDFLEAGGAGFRVGDLFGWGTSAGGTATVVLAARRGGFDGLVVDSAACDLVIEYRREAEVLDHVMGGDPDDPGASPRYRADSCNTLVSDGILRVPVALLYNAQDRLVTVDEPRNFASALEAEYGNAGLRYFVQDYDHAFPGTDYHVQSKVSLPPPGYVPGLMLDFLDGARLYWREAEDVSCPDCVGGVGSGDEWVAHSGGAGREAAVGEAGVMLEMAVPGEVMAQEGSRVEAVFLLAASRIDALDPDEEVALLRWTSGSVVQELHLTRREFPPPGGIDDASLMRQYVSTRLDFAPGDSGAGTVALVSAGVADLRVDGVMFVVR